MSESSEVPLGKTEMSAQVKEYFKGRELPTHVRTHQGTAYYLSLDNISQESFKTKRRDGRSPGFDSLETRALVVNTICPPEEGEVPDASFKFVGERGLYVRVQVEEYDKTKEPRIRWQVFNEDDVESKKRRFV